MVQTQLMQNNNASAYLSQIVKAAQRVLSAALKQIDFPTPVIPGRMSLRRTLQQRQGFLQILHLGSNHCQAMQLVKHCYAQFFGIVSPARDCEIAPIGREDIAPQVIVLVAQVLICVEVRKLDNPGTCPERANISSNMRSVSGDVVRGELR
jgi:hypothetical protein